MQHLGLLPISTKAASKATKNGQHNHHSAEHSTRILSKLGNPSDFLPRSFVSAAELCKTAGDPYLFHDVDVKSVASNIGLSRAANSIPIARLYPELAEKLDLESKTTRLDGHKAVNLASVSSRLSQLSQRLSQPLNHVSAPLAAKQVKHGTRQSADDAPSFTRLQKQHGVSRPAAASLPTVVSSQFPLVVTSSNRSSFELQTSNAPNLTRLMLDPVINSAAVVSSPVIGYPWQTSASGGSAASMAHTASQLLSQAQAWQQGLVNVTSVAQTGSLPSLKFPAPRSDVSMSSIRPNQNAPVSHSLRDPTPFDTGKTTVKTCVPVVRPQTVALSRSTPEDASHLNSQPCMTCMVRPRPRPNWRHKVELRRRKALHRTAWKLYSDHVARVDCSADILPCGMLSFVF